MTKIPGFVYGGSVTDGTHTEWITSRGYITLALWIMGIGRWSMRSGGGTFTLDYPSPLQRIYWATVREVS